MRLIIDIYRHGVMGNEVLSLSRVEKYLYRRVVMLRACLLGFGCVVASVTAFPAESLPKRMEWAVGDVTRETLVMLPRTQRKKRSTGIRVSRARRHDETCGRGGWNTPAPAGSTLCVPGTAQHPR